MGAEPRGHRAAVIGDPVEHSLSPVLHRAAYRRLGLDHWTYEARRVAPAALAAVLEQVAAPAQGAVWAGLSVTMPHKQALIPHLDIVDPLASTVGAVNTVLAQRSGTGAALLAGFNTDVAGIVEALREITAAREPGGPAPLRAVVLGSGATACSALAALSELGATSMTIAARRHAGPGRAQAAARRMGLNVTTLTWRVNDQASHAEVARALAAADLIVTTLPAHAADPLALPLGRALAARGGPRPGAAMLDVVYDPWPTAIAAAWQDAGGAVAPGWLMLLHQAAPQVRLMTGRQPDLNTMRAALLAAIAR